MAGITLAQVAALETEPLRKGIILNIIRDAPVMETVPFENISSLRAIGLRWSKLPTGGAWRKLNAGYTASQEGTVEQVEDSLYGFGGEITYDKVLTKITNFVEDPITVQTKMKIKSLAYDWKDKFINGDHAVDPDAIEGLKKRVAASPTRQTVYMAASNAAPLDPTGSTANARKFFDQWEAGWHYCNGGQVSEIFCNEGTLLGFARVHRYLQINGNMLDVTKDTLGREFLTWKGKRLVDMGYKADQSTEIITDTEVAGDGGADSTSVYFVSYDKDQGITGIQLEPLQVYDPLAGGESSSAPMLLRRIDWWNGLLQVGSYGIVRLRNLAAASSWT